MARSVAVLRNLVPLSSSLYLFLSSILLIVARAKRGGDGDDEEGEGHSLSDRLLPRFCRALFSW
jgi:hypothetical protein